MLYVWASYNMALGLGRHASGMPNGTGLQLPKKLGLSVNNINTNTPDNNEKCKTM